MLNEELITLKDPNSYISERYKMLRTNLYNKEFEGKKTLLLTSSNYEEGKSTTAANLAVTIAQANKKVLLIDGDLRNPKVHDLFRTSQTPGLTEVLSKNKSFQEKAVIKQSLLCKGLDIITSGETVATPSELLESSVFVSLLNEAKGLYDIIIIDAPPVVEYTDGAIIAKLVDGVILVAQSNKTDKSAIINSKNALEKVHATILGVVLKKEVSNFKLRKMH